MANCKKNLLQHVKIGCHDAIFLQLAYTECIYFGLWLNVPVAFVPF